MRRIKARRYGEASAMGLFLDMLNPKFQGKGFTWAGFPELAERTAKVGLYQAFWPSPTEAEKEAAAQAARLWAQAAVRRAGLIEESGS